MPVRQLPEQVVNRIAAGEVVERPASVVKELVENAIDAGASRIDIFTDGGGRRRIGITDDGGGMTSADLALAVDRHATSKLDDEDLLQIRTLGFRGEALPSIASVARLTLESRVRGAEGWSRIVDNGALVAEGPAAIPPGTRVRVEQLFARVPARRKFLRSPRAEYGQSLDVVKRLAMARPDIAFSLDHDGRRALSVPAGHCMLATLKWQLRGSVMIPSPGTPSSPAQALMTALCSAVSLAEVRIALPLASVLTR